MAVGGDGTASCVVIRPRPAEGRAQGLPGFEGVSAETAGSRALCMHLVTIPPGGRARAHLHAAHESVLYVLEGVSETWYGERLERCAVARAGEFLYIPAGVPHVAVNASATEPCRAVVARTDPSEAESVVLRPDLDALVPASGGAGL